MAPGMRTSTPLFLLSCLSLTLLGACAGEPGDDVADDDVEQADDLDDLGDVEVGTTEQSIDGNWAVGPYWNSTPGTAVVLMPVSTHHCVLSRVGGLFAGTGEDVHVEQSGANWVLRVSSAQPGTGQHGEAYCYNKSAFLANGTARWSSGTSFTWNGAGSGCAQRQLDLWWGDAASIVQGMIGNFRGGGEWVSIYQSPYGFTPSSVTSQGCSGWVGGYAGSLFVGTPSSGVPAKFWGGEFHVSTEGLIVPTREGEVAMAPTNEAMCYLTRVAGRFDGGGEYIAVYPKRDASGIERWHLITRAGAKTGSNQIKPLYASARCLRRDQR